MTRNILFFLIMIFLAVPASAQPAPLPMHSFVPAGAWKVQPTVVQGARQLDSIKLPCMMMVEYDNGFVLRLSGGNGRLLAMALDVRQNVFNQGQQYNVALAVNQVPEGFIRASAFTNSVLILNVRETRDLYQKLAGAQVLTLDIEGNIFQFNLGSIMDATNRLEACYTGKPTTPVQMAALPGMPAPPMVPMATPAEPELNPDEQWALTRSRVSKMPDVEKPDISSAYYDQDAEQRWTAQKGENLSAVLSRWGDHAGVAIDWQADDADEQVVSNFDMRSSFEMAVQSLLAQNATTTGLQADLMGSAPSPSNMPQPIMPVASSSAPAMVPSAAVVPVPNTATQWQAARGDNLRIILQRWAEREGIELYWQANQPFAVRQNVGLDGPFPQAIEALLGQYLGEDVRPIAQLNTDPTNGRRILIIESSRVL